MRLALVMVYLASGGSLQAHGGILPGSSFLLSCSQPRLALLGAGQRFCGLLRMLHVLPVL